MPKIKTKKTRYPDGWELIEDTLHQLNARMRDVETADTSKQRKDELLWPIFRLHHQRTRYVYDMHYVKHEISKQLLDWCVKQGYADAGLMSKWRKPGYEQLCCVRCIQPRDTNFGTTCVPEKDTRVLTDAGFLFLKEIEALRESRRAVGKEVLYACYEKATQRLVYAPGRIFTSPPPARWVDFTQEATRRFWDERGDDYGSTVPSTGEANRLTLRTTPEHEMFVQVGTYYAHLQVSRMRGADHTSGAIAPHKMPAVELAPGFACDCGQEDKVECAHGYNVYRVFTAPAQGVRSADVMSVEDRSPDSPVVALGLRTDDQLCAFLELYGYWLGDGSMLYSTATFDWADIGGGVRFTPKKLRDRDYLYDLMRRLGLVEGTDWYQWEMRVCLHLVISAPGWLEYFDAEYGVKYRGSPHYDPRAALAKQIGSAEEEDEPDDPDTPIKSVKWLWAWALTRLDKKQLRFVIEGLRQADGRSAQTTEQAEAEAAGGSPMAGAHMICTSSAAFRDRLVQLCLHAGYSAYFKLNTRAGDVRGYYAVPSDYCTYTPEEMAALLVADPTRVFSPMVGKHDNWWVQYSESTSELLPARDVRYDGRPLQLGTQRKYKEGWVALHEDGTAHAKEKMDDLAPIVGCKRLAMFRARRAGRLCGRPPVWRIFMAAEYQEYQQLLKRDTPQPAAATALAQTYDVQRDERVWCVEVQHRDHLIFAQRAHRAANGVVTKVGRAMIVGNCVCRVPKKDLEEGKLIECVHCGCRGCASGDA